MQLSSVLRHTGFRSPMSALALIVLACSQAAAPNQYTRFRLRDNVTSDRFQVEIAGRGAVAQADSLIRSQVPRYVIGKPVAGDGGYNAPWHWHLDPNSIAFGESVIEVCMTTAPSVEQALDSWTRLGLVCIEAVVEARAS